MRGENSTHSMRYAPHQGPTDKPSRFQGKPGLEHSVQLRCRGWRIIHVTDMNRHLVTEVFYGVHIRNFVDVDVDVDVDGAGVGFGTGDGHIDRDRDRDRDILTSHETHNSSGFPV